MARPQFDSSAFGSTGDCHAAVMGILWGPGINIAVILSFYKYKKRYSIIHGIYGLILWITTLATSLPILLHTGIIRKDSASSFKFSAAVLNSHYLVGIVCMFLISAQAILGIMVKLMHYRNEKSIMIVNTKRIHVILGYITLIICKSNYVIIQSESGQFWGLLILDTLFLIAGIYWKLKFPRMEAKTNSQAASVQVDCIQSVRELNRDRSYAIFANYVYDIEPLKHYHPAGFSAVETVKNKEIDRYIYGMEALPNMPIHSHTFKCLSLVGPPLATITISPTFGGFDQDQVPVRISSLRLISKKGQIYEMRLDNVEGGFIFQGYSSLFQLGRYHSLNLDDRTTRLYSSVTFLARRNKIFMEKYLKGYSDHYGEYVGLGQYLEIPEMANWKFQPIILEEGIPILFKRYDKGKLSGPLSRKEVHKLALSRLKGEGLQLSHLKPGRVLIVAAGTGIFPFCDLIDLLYKYQLLKENQSLKYQIIKLSPILANGTFDAFTFDLLAAFGNLEDIHPITLHQLAFLSKCNRLKLTIRIKNEDMEGVNLFQNATITNVSFRQYLTKEWKEGLYSKLLICGPAKMVEDVSIFVREQGLALENYLIL